MASPWQLVLRMSSPTHQELFLFAYAWQHDNHHSCKSVFTKDLVAQKAGPAQTAAIASPQVGDPATAPRDIQSSKAKRTNKFAPDP